MKIVAFEVQHREVSSFEPLRAKHEIVLLEEPLRADNAKRFQDAEILCPFVYSGLSAGVLQDMPQIRMIATRSTGYDHINIRYCKEKGIVVSNVPSYGEATVAEHVFALLLTISHKLREALDRARDGEFSPIGLEGFDLARKTLGVIGVGSIGRHVVRIARGFEMNVIAFDLKPDSRLAADLASIICHLTTCSSKPTF